MLSQKDKEDRLKNRRRVFKVKTDPSSHEKYSRKIFLAKQKKLTVLTQQSQQNAASDDRLRKLRERALEQENRLKQFRISADQPQNTALLSAELTSVRNLLESKQRELTQSMIKVDKITQQLADLQKTQDASSSTEIGKLNRELGIQFYTVMHRKPVF